MSGKITSKIYIYLAALLLVALPLAYFPAFQFPFSTAKNLVLIVGVAGLLAIKVIDVLVSGHLNLRFGKLDLAVLCLILVYLLASGLVTPNKMEAFWVPGGATVVIAGALLYFLVNQV